MQKREKHMRYEKPVVINISAGARTATGLWPMSCVDGTSPVDQGVCGNGTTPTYNSGCVAGPDAGDCAGGSAAGFTCLSGVSTYYSYECENGSGGTAGSCAVGPSANP